MLKELICLETNATTTEQHQSFEVDEIVFVANDDSTNSVIFNFDESSGADTNKHGLDSAWMLYLDCYAQFIGHIALVGDTPCHKVADEENVPVLASGKTVTNLCAGIISLKSCLNAHDTDASTYHYAAGTDHQVTSSDPTTLAAAITCINEIKSDLTAHMADDDCHGLVDTTNVITVADAKAGDMTVLKSEQHNETIPKKIHTLYFKSSSGTVPFRIWGTKMKYKA
jgi:hypothetical protein